MPEDSWKCGVFIEETMHCNGDFRFLSQQRAALSFVFRQTYGYMKNYRKERGPGNLMSVLTECSNLWNYQSVTTCSELLSCIILNYISKCIKGSSWKNKIKKGKSDLYLKSFFSGMAGVSTQATLILKWL